MTVALLVALLLAAAAAAACSAQATAGAGSPQPERERTQRRPDAAGETPPATRPAATPAARPRPPPAPTGRASLQALGYMQAVTPTEPVVVLLGGSAARESTISDASWRDQIVAKGGPADAGLEHGLAQPHAWRRTWPS